MTSQFKSKRGRENFMEAAERELVAFEKREREFCKSEKQERAAQLDMRSFKSELRRFDPQKAY